MVFFLKVLATLILLFNSGLNPTGNRVEAETLVVGIGDHQMPPYVFSENHELTGGILKELVDELGLRLGLEVKYLLLPRKRLDQSLSKGLIHLIPHTNPKWHNNELGLLWSPPWSLDQNRFVLNHTNLFALSEFDDLNGKQLGTIRGHRYGALDFWLEHRFIERSDARTLEQNFHKLGSGRIDALIGSKVIIAYQLRIHSTPEQFLVPALVADEHQRFIALTPNAPCSIEQLSSALQQMLDEGRVNEILKSYR